jgi:rhamnosyltransferase
MISPISVHAVVVTYNPDLIVLGRVIVATLPQVEKIWIIDNASNYSLQSWLSSLDNLDKIVLTSMPSNLGIGAAHNAGIMQAKLESASHVLLLDQDSQPMQGMLDNLLSACVQLQTSGYKVAAVAPLYKDSANGDTSGFVRLGWFNYKHQVIKDNRSVVETDFIISSGSLIPTDSLNKIGEMDVSLFIDHVDTEWCLRAKAKGYQLFGVCSAYMIHTLGDKRLRIWFLRWRTIPYHAPFRYYYILRNSILLQRRAEIPIKWRIAELSRSLKIIIFYGIFGKQRIKCLSMMSSGIYDGICGISGKNHHVS